MAEKHIHPLNPDQIVYGEHLEVGVRLEPSDVYDSTCGKWLKVPCPGAIIQHGSSTYFVRPVKAKN